MWQHCRPLCNRISRIKFPVHHGSIWPRRCCVIPQSFIKGYIDPVRLPKPEGKRTRFNEYAHPICKGDFRQNVFTCSPWCCSVCAPRFPPKFHVVLRCWHVVVSHWGEHSRCSLPTTSCCQADDRHTGQFPRRTPPPPCGSSPSASRGATCDLTTTVPAGRMSMLQVHPIMPTDTRGRSVTR